ncbi:LysR family transcriptional regulator [Pseudomonas chlororaphis]|nr:LysR family transcriptional regulator [Pseudomonas chlororaphis]
MVWISQAESLGEAARHLNLPKSTVSWRISDLEERIGVLRSSCRSRGEAFRRGHSSGSSR